MYDELVKDLRENHDKYFARDMQAADAIKELQGRAKVLEKVADKWREAVPKWIPVTEQLPDGRHDVLVYAGVLFTYIAVGYYDRLWKFSFDDSAIAGGVDYWMPLPEPPKEE